MSHVSIDPHRRLRELGLELPKAPAPMASYVQTRMVPVGDGRAMLYVSGQVCREGDRILSGRCPDEVTVEEAIKRARLCGLAVLAQIEAAGGLERVEQIAQLIGFVLSADTFGEQPKVVNGASDLLLDVFGDAGRHTRAALGTNALPLSATVETAAVAVVRTD